jgi:hypothetical protein
MKIINKYPDLPVLFLKPKCIDIYLNDKEIPPTRSGKLVAAIRLLVKSVEMSEEITRIQILLLLFIF